MDLFFLFFKLGPALKYIFELGYIPQEKDFKELTPEQYAAFHRHADEEDLKEISGKRILTLLPDDIEANNRLVNLYGDQLLVISQDEYDAFVKASEFIDRCCSQSGLTFTNLNDKLAYLAKRLPYVFTEGTPYAFYGKSKSHNHD